MRPLPCCECYGSVQFLGTDMISSRIYKPKLAYSSNVDFCGFMSCMLKNGLNLICMCSMARIECHGSDLVIFSDLCGLWPDLWPE